MEEPMLRVWLQDSVEPRPSYDVRPGRWAAEDSWPSPRIGVRRWDVPLPEPRPLLGVQSCGAEAGAWTAEGQSADLAGDQRRDDAVSLAFDSEPLEAPLELLGFPEAALTLTSDRPLALVAVRLCEVFPDGTSALVARGLLNLAHRDGHAEPSPLEPGRLCRVRVPLDFAAHSLPAGRRLRLAVSPTYWPWAWPSPEPVTLTLHAAALELPERPARPEDAELRPFAEPEHSAPLAVDTVAAGEQGRTVCRDLATGLVEQVFDWDLGGSVRLVDIDLRSWDTSRTVFSIREGDPLSAEVRFRATSGMARGEWSALAEVTATMTADAGEFRVETALAAHESGERVFARSWTQRFPRDHV
jgi:hypothetical protein